MAKIKELNPFTDVEKNDQMDKTYQRLPGSKSIGKGSISEDLLSFFVHDPGDLKAISHSTVPNGWLLCDGSAINRTTYRRLFDKIGVTYGVGDGSTTFNIPDMQGKFVVGLDSTDADFDTIGETGGAKAATLSTTGATAGGDFDAVTTTSVATVPPYITINWLIKY